MITIEIIQDCKKKKQAAQRKVFDCFASYMFNVCFRYMNNREEAEDMVSLGFVKVFNAISDFEYRDINSLRAWIKKIMINGCLMRLRQLHNFSLVSIDDYDDQGYDDPGMFQIEAASILETLKQLPPGYQTILNLFSIEGYTHAEIAQMLNISEGTSRSQLNKARRQMKEKLNQMNLVYGKKTI